MLRIDNYLSEKYSISRHKAQFLIERGLVSANGKIITKNSFEVKENIEIVLHESKEINYVSRRAKKLDDFLVGKNINIKDKICLDIGASTGGFTQILLEKEAKKIYAIDVGTMQLSPILKNNPKIISIENTDIRDFKTDIVFDIITADVSFISLKKIIGNIINLGDNNTNYILLFKPQFEVGNINLTKKGVPKNIAIIKKTLDNFLDFLRKLDLKIITIEKSSLPGENGNTEYFINFTKKYEQGNT